MTNARRCSPRFVTALSLSVAVGFPAAALDAQSPPAEPPADWGPILDEIGATHLEHLAANAAALQEGRQHFEAEFQGVRYRNLPGSRYRVWCLEQLRAHFERLPDPESARALLARHGCWEPLWRVAEPTSGVDPEGTAPFGPGHSMTGL